MNMNICNNSVKAAVSAIVILIAGAAVAPAAVIFEEDFSGSTVMSASPAAPTGTSTDYAVLSSKNAMGSTLLDLNLSSGTSSGFGEMQALFTTTPVVLGAGQSITLQLTFQGTYLLDKSDGTSQTLNVGLFDSGGSYPVPDGLMANGGMGTGTGFVTGYAQNWSGFVGRVACLNAGNGSDIYTRDPQTDTTDENQDLLFNNVGTGAYDTPTGQSVAGGGAQINLTDGVDYTLVFTVLNDGADIQVSETIYEGVGTGGAMVYSLSGTAPTGYEYVTFDSLAFGARFSASSAPGIQVTALSVETDAPAGTAPFIGNLDDVTAAAGDTVTLTPTVTGSPTPACQWLENGSALAGETNTALVLSNVQVGQSGYTYSLVAGNEYGAATNSMTLTVLSEPVRAFPGAEGAGADALGGRGGDVYYVTTLADNNSPGSMRYGINTAPAGGRTICFKVSGNIVLNSTLTINRDRITVAGQTAPGDGICFQDYSFNIAASDIVVRHIRSRLGTNALQEADCMWIYSGSDIIVDHVSASWSVDEVLSSSRDVSNLTVQNCFITEALNNSIHEKGSHGYGGILSSDNWTTYSYLRNLYAHNRSRNPRIGSSQDPANPNTLRLDFKNNVIYNYGDRAGYTAGAPESCEVNYIRNYSIKGPSSTYNFILYGGGTSTHVYQDGNFNDINVNGILDGFNSGWGMFSGTYTAHTNRFSVPDASEEAAPVAYQRVVALSGAMPWRRDSADQRIAGTVRQQNGTIIDAVDEVGTWPVLNSETAPTDSDSDGMPDYWETAVGLNPADASDRNDIDVSGYTELEVYLNWLAEAHAHCYRNGYVDVDLREATGGASHLTYSVTNGLNGSVVLLEDGHTARFTAGGDISGAANFTFIASDPDSSVSFGPIPFGILISAVNAPRLDLAANDSNMTLSWSTEQIGWTLEAQTNGLDSGWFAVPDSTTTNEITVPVFPGAGNAFFRLRYP